MTSIRVTETPLVIYVLRRADDALVRVQLGIAGEHDEAHPDVSESQMIRRP